MRKILIETMRVAAFSAIAGCVSVYRVSEMSPGNGDAPPPHPAVPVMRMPAVQVKAVASDAKANALADAMKVSAERNLSARGFTVAPKAKPDSILSLDVSSRVAAELAEWRVCEGKVDVRVTDALTGAITARTSITAKGERALGAAKAEENLARAMETPLSGWLVKAMPARKIAASCAVPPSVAVTMVTLSPADLSEDPDNVLAVQRRFMDSVASHPGIVSCRLAREMPSSREFTFRIEYLPAQFPNGLLNTLVLDMPRFANGVKLEIAR